MVCLGLEPGAADESTMLWRHPTSGIVYHLISSKHSLPLGSGGGQVARLLLRRSEFESQLCLQF